MDHEHENEQHHHNHNHEHDREHDRAHDHGCSCGHDHIHTHDHKHSHDHKHGCSCGHHHAHTHDHEHSHEHDCCGHEHDHDHGCSCGCGHHHHHGEGVGKKEIAELILGAGLFILAIILHFALKEETYSLPLILMLAAAYLILGHGVLLASLKNIRRGEIFDENFLMSIATLGAFVIQEYPEAVGVMLFFRLGELFEELAVSRSRSKILQAVNMKAETVTLAEGHNVIPAENAKAGDVILVSPGDRVPLDGLILAGESLLDTSAITGESLPRPVGPGDELLAGCINMRGMLTLQATQPLSQSMTSRILQSVEEAQDQKPRIEHFITRFARVYTPIVVGLALFVAIAMPLIRGEAFTPWLYTAISFLVMSCPCALVVSVPLAFFCGIGTASGRGILFKGGSAMEALSRARAAVLDKTGTLTEGRFVLRQIRTFNGFREDEVLSLAAACEAGSRHPIGESIVTAARERGLALPAAQEMEEQAGGGIRALVEGKLIHAGKRDYLKEAQVKLAELDLPAGTEVLLSVDGILAAQMEVADTLKEDAASAVVRLKKLGLSPVMLSGDKPETAREVADRAGIRRAYGALLPDEKLKLMQELRDELGPVLFVGDGMNDAPVLAGADVGAAMGDGADAAIEAADLVFMNSNVSAIPQAIRLSRRAMTIARENVIGALAIKILVIILGISGIYSNMWLAVFADTGVLFLCILNALRLLSRKD